uniref:DUF8204 domain-containing protein n=1 Tax=Nelumbo nucifera TaxID=4432 RepID=A0A822ZAF2_NELNU|nr:TPA_asm: hypothetical protein HUJ06_014732 [Nelumbo nucifera]
MAVGKEDEGDQNQIQAKGMKGKSCKGCLYYSSILKSKSRNPRCVGVSRTLQQGLSLSLLFLVFLGIGVFPFS